ncbi:hypothetical protein SPBR_06068 [Sporothrix brasiliensis 5110]|uniref:Uncharacterized protein n=1 Tax=Sporothrix brasiliensis 5110 TaxID=1398154 RepID=A0A0C2JCJ6_9PEZI|nr:uncharacterized protein SPBR_06068 [Sporothrix brasiliensis 5110]KIH94632.1 hypothetical protein SPBR_06068 [Sporothrix brasiliensis 5110]
MKDDEILKEERVEAGIREDEFGERVGDTEKEADGVMDGRTEGEMEGELDSERDDNGGALLKVELADKGTELLLMDMDEADGTEADKDEETDQDTGTDDDVALKSGWTPPLVGIDGETEEVVVLMLDVRVAPDKSVDDDVEALLVELGQRGGDDDENGKPDGDALGEYAVDVDENEEADEMNDKVVELAGKETERVTNVEGTDDQDTCGDDQDDADDESLLDETSADDDGDGDSDALAGVRVDTVVRSVTVVIVVNSVTVVSEADEDEADDGETGECEVGEDDAVTVWATATVVLNVTPG